MGDMGFLLKKGPCHPPLRESKQNLSVTVNPGSRILILIQRNQTGSAALQIAARTDCADSNDLLVWRQKTYTGTLEGFRGSGERHVVVRALLAGLLSGPDGPAFPGTALLAQAAGVDSDPPEVTVDL